VIADPAQEWEEVARGELSGRLTVVIEGVNTEVEHVDLVEGNHAQDVEQTASQADWGQDGVVEKGKVIFVDVPLLAYARASRVPFKHEVFGCESGIAKDLEQDLGRDALDWWIECGAADWGANVRHGGVDEGILQEVGRENEK
jgi:hypothetical protein